MAPALLRSQAIGHAAIPALVGHQANADVNRLAATVDDACRRVPLEGCVELGFRCRDALIGVRVGRRLAELVALVKVLAELLGRNLLLIFRKVGFMLALGFGSDRELSVMRGEPSTELDGSAC